MLPNACRNALDIFHINDNDTLENLKLIQRLNFHPLNDSYIIQGMECRGDPNPMQSMHDPFSSGHSRKESTMKSMTEGSSRYSLLADPSEAIITISLDAVSESRGNAETINVVVHRSALAKLALKGALSQPFPADDRGHSDLPGVPWIEWGPVHTRLRIVVEDDGWVTNSAGQRQVFVTRDNALGAPFLVVRDFNPYSVRRQRIKKEQFSESESTDAQTVSTNASSPIDYAGTGLQTVETTLDGLPNEEFTGTQETAHQISSLSDENSITEEWHGSDEEGVDMDGEGDDSDDLAEQSVHSTTSSSSDSLFTPDWHRAFNIRPKPFKKVEVLIQGYPDLPSQYHCLEEPPMLGRLPCVQYSTACDDDVFETVMVDEDRIIGIAVRSPLRS
jgi:hypothetical protein